MHVGEKCTVEVKPADVRSKDYPSIGKFTTKISELSQRSEEQQGELGWRLLNGWVRCQSLKGRIQALARLCGSSCPTALGKWRSWFGTRRLTRVEGLLKVGAQVAGGEWEG